MRRDAPQDAGRSTSPSNSPSSDAHSGGGTAHIERISVAANERTDEQVCAVCGQRLQRGANEALGGRGVSEETDAVRAASRVGPATWLTVALLAIFAAALLIGWRGETSEPLSEPDTEPTSSENAPNETPIAETGTDPGGEDPGGDEYATNTGESLTGRDLVAATKGALVSLIGANRLAYASPDGVVIIDPAAPVDPVSVLEPLQVTMIDLLSGFDSFSMLHEQGHTYGFKRDVGSDTRRVYQLATQGQVVAGPKSSFSLVVGGAEAVDHLYVGNSSGLFMSRLEVPVGAELRAVPAVGVLVTASTGETFVTTQSGFKHFSNWPVVAANAMHHVEIRCSEPLVCTPVLVDRASGVVVDLPTEFAKKSVGVAIAPDGAHLLLAPRATGSSGPGRYYDVDNATLTPLAAMLGDRLVWAADSTVAAWLDPATSDPRLWVFDVASTDVESVDLTSLGAPPPSGNGLALLPP